MITTPGMTVYSILDGMPPARKAQLETTPSYCRFTLAQAKLDELAAAAWEETGTLNTPEMLSQKKIVAALGEALLGEFAAMGCAQEEAGKDN